MHPESDKEQPGERPEAMRMSEIKSDVTEEELTKILAKVDKESTVRKLSGYQYRIVYWVAVAFSCFQVYTAMFGAYPAQIQRSVHLSFAFVLVFLLYPFRTRTAVNRLRVRDYLFAAFAAWIGVYLTVNYVRLMETAGDYTRADMVVGVCGTLLTLEAARRVVGTPIVVIASSFLAYAYFGAYLPGFLSQGYSIERIVSHMYFTTEGILGIPLGVSATFIFLFILFGAFLEKTGIGKLFIDIADAIAGGNLLLTMFFTMITSLILGMGVPTTANYVITATMAAPALVLLGVEKLAAHLFVFYFGIIADITPPVALAAYAGAGIARANPFWTGVTASKLAVGAFIVPYIFVLNPAMVLIGTTPYLLSLNLVTACGGMFGIGAAMIGFCVAPMNWLERIWFAIAGLMLIDPSTVTDIIGIMMLVAGLVVQYRKKKVWERQDRPPPQPSRGFAN